MIQTSNRRDFLQRAGALCLATANSIQGAVLDPSHLTVCGCSLTNLGFEGTLRQIQRLGFSGVEIATFVEKNSPAGDTYPYAVVDNLTDDEKIRLKTIVKQFRHVTTHLPYYPDFRPIAADTTLRAQSRRELLRSVDDSGFWGASVATVHVASEKGRPYSEAKSDLIDFYRELGDRAAKYKLRLAIETTQPYRISEYLDLVEAIGRDNVGGNVDVGHIKFFRDDVKVADADRGSPLGVQRYNDLLMEVVKSLGPKLFHIHVHDVRATDWQDHHVPGTGIVDFARLFKYLAGVGYNKLFAAEILYYRVPQEDGLKQARAFLSELMRRGGT